MNRTPSQLHDLQEIFIQNVAHELRTPLSLIMGFAEILADGGMGQINPEQITAVGHIQRNALNLKQLIERLEILLAVEAKKYQLNSVSLSALVAEVATLLWPRITENNQTLSLYADPESPMVLADANHLRQAVICLVENAVKFTPAGGRITLRVYADSQWACLAIQDSGIGIPPTQLQKIFDRFYQIDGSTKRHYGGLGLGLALAHDVVLSQGGQLMVNSQVGQGSTFTLKLPLAHLKPESHAQQPFLATLKSWFHKLTNESHWLTQPTARHLNVHGTLKQIMPLHYPNGAIIGPQCVLWEGPP